MAQPTGEKFLELVAAQIGTPYVWGGAAPGGFDCSGLVYWAAHALGIRNFPRTSEDQWNAVDRIRADQLQPGDLIFMNFPGEQAPGHVVIYAGGDTIVQAPSTGQLVQEDSYTAGTAQQWGATIVGYGRIPGINYAGEPVTTNLGTGGTTTGGARGGGGGGTSKASWWDTFWFGILGGNTVAESIAGSPSNIGAGAITGLGDTAQAILAFTHIFDKLINALDWFFHPNHWIRIIAGAGGGVLVIMGTVNMTHTVKIGPVSSGGAGLPFGILEVGTGGILLFVAFHNVPPGIKTFPEFLGFLTDQIKIGSAKATTTQTLPGTSQAPGTVTAGGRGA